jgi:hypothetical protein
MKRGCLPTLLERKGRHDKCQHKENKVADDAKESVINKQDSDSIDNSNSKKNPGKNT